MLDKTREMDLVKTDLHSNDVRANHGLHPARLSPLEIGGHTRFQGVLWRKLFHEPRRAGEA